MKNPLRHSSTLKASFLHDDDEWDPSVALATPEIDASLASHLEHPDGVREDDDDSTAPKDEDEGGGRGGGSGKEGGKLDPSDPSGSTAGSTVDASAHRNVSKRSLYSNATDESHADGSYKFSSAGSSRSESSSEGRGSSRDNDSYNNSDAFRGCNTAARAASLSTISASRSSLANEEEQTPHELAALVARRVKASFERNLPDALSEDHHKRDTVAPYKSTEIVLGPLLGSGEFSNVYEIKSFRPSPTSENTLQNEGRSEELETRRHMKRRERYHDTRKACYAVKHLRPELVETYGRLEYAQSASDLALEAEFLASLQHPNIIKLRGISFDGAEGFAQGPKGYFLIIDRLNETLDVRIKRWRKSKKRGGLLSSSWKAKMRNKRPTHLLVNGGMGRGYNRHGSDGDGAEGNREKGVDERSGIGEDQVDVGMQIASAMMYLHEKSVMFRDLKPQNIGFDVRGDVKLFDFGLATVMPPFGDPYEDKFNMSGAGSPRYMAPEVLIDPPKDYNMKADVYTYGIVLWCIFSLEVPFGHIHSRDELVDFVVEQHGRPPIDESWPEPIKEALKLGFEADMTMRPSIQLFYNMLRFQLLNLRDGDDTKLDNAFIKRRRSFGSMRDLDISKEELAPDDGHQQSHEKFPQRVKNRILNHVKSPPQPQAAANGDNSPAPPGRRRRTRMRDKFRLSVKHEVTED